MKKNQHASADAHGKLILLEGLSGSAKTLQAKRLVAFLEKKGLIVQFGAEPTKNNMCGKAIRKIIEHTPFTKDELDAFRREVALLQVRLAARAFGVSRENRDRMLAFCRMLGDIPEKVAAKRKLTELERQLLFLADRFLDIQDTILPALDAGKWFVLDRYDLSNFAYGGACGLTIEELYAWHVAVLGKDYLIPDLTLFISVTPRIAVGRLVKSGKALDRYESLETLARVDAQYTCAIPFLMSKSVEAGMKDSLAKPIQVAIIDGRQSRKRVFHEIEKTLKRRGVLPKSQQ